MTKNNKLNIALLYFDDREFLKYPILPKTFVHFFFTNNGNFLISLLRVTILLLSIEPYIHFQMLLFRLAK
jgi:hypothetical protein